MQQQPYRRGARQPSEALMAMQRGRTAGGVNPMDAQRAMQMLQRVASQSRPKRPARPDRPPRPQR